MADRTLEVLVVVEGDTDDDAADIETLRDSASSSLRDHDFEVTRQPYDGATPLGAKIGDPSTFNTLVVAVAASGGVLTTLIGALQAWLVRTSARQVVLELDGDRLELTGVSSDERRQLAELWISRHRAGDDAEPPHVR